MNKCEGPAGVIHSVHLSFNESPWTGLLPCFFIIPAGLSLPKARQSTLRQLLPFGQGRQPVACRRETPGGGSETVHCDPGLSVSTAETCWRAGKAKVLVLAVDGSTVCFGFPRRADYPHEAVSELLQDQPLCFCLRLVSLFCLFGLFHQTLACRFKHLLCYERVWQPAGRWKHRQLLYADRGIESIM